MGSIATPWRGRRSAESLPTWTERRRRMGSCRAHEHPVVGRDQRRVEDLRGLARRSASQTAVTLTHSGSFRRRGAPGGDRKGASVSTSSRSAGTQPGDVRAGLLPRPEDETAERDREAEREHGLGVVDRTRERVDDRRRAAVERGQRRPDRRSRPSRSSPTRQVLGVALPDPGAAVEDRRLAGRQGEREVAPQVGELGLERREAPVGVEAGLADRDDPGIGGQLDDLRPAGVVDLGRGVGMDPDRGVEPRDTGRPGRRPPPTRPGPSPGRGAARRRPSGRRRATSSTSPAKRSAWR